MLHKLRKSIKKYIRGIRQGWQFARAEKFSENYEPELK